jgi:hypothetical protein
MTAIRWNSPLNPTPNPVSCTVALLCRTVNAMKTAALAAQ